MPLEPIKSFHLKKPHSDSQLSFKSNQSPTGSARRTSQQAKAYGFPNPEPSINKPQKTFSVVLNGSAVKIEKPKATKSVKIITSKEKILKSSTTLTELYVTPGSSFRESVSNRTMKSPTQFVRQGSLDMKSYSPGIKTSGGETPTSFSLKSVRPNELVAILQSKNEEINRLKTNIQDLQVLLSLKKSNDSKMEKLEEMKHNINLKDNVIEVYEKLLMLCSGKAPYTLKMLSTEGGEDVPKQGTSSTSIKLNSVKVASMAEAQSNNCSIASLLPKSMNWTSSPTPGDRNESPLHLKIVEQDSQVGKGESLSPTYRLTTKGGSHIIQKIKVKSESMVKVKVVPDKYRAEARLFRERGDLALKSGLSKSLSPSMDLERPRVKIEIENNTEIRNQDSSCSKEYGLGGGHSPKSSIGRFLLKQNSEVSLGKDLNRLVERFGSAFKNMEEKNKALIKKTEFMKKKLEEYEMNKQHEEKKLE